MIRGGFIVGVCDGFSIVGGKRRTFIFLAKKKL
jgi:hypothetical protein